MKTPSVARTAATAAGLCSVVILCGCTVLAEAPAHPTVADLQNGLSWNRALTYLADARASLEAGQKSVDHLNTVTLGGVGAGTVGASVATLAKAHPDLILGSLTVAGMSYALNQTSMPATQSQVYKAGLERLACIRTAAYQAHQSTDYARAPLRALEPRLRQATTKLADDLSAAHNVASPDAALKTLIGRGDTALAAAIELQATLTRFFKDSDIGFALYTAVDATVREVNSQLRERAPSLATIANAGSVVGGFVNVHSKLATDANSTKAAGLGVGAIASAKHQTLADQLVMDLAVLQKVADEIGNALPRNAAVNTASLGSCAMNLPDQDVRVVTPAAAPVLKAGGDVYSLTVEQTDSRPIFHDFDGATPTAQNLAVSPSGDGRFGLAAPPGAAAASYVMYFYVKDGDTRKRLRPTVTVSVVKPEAPSAGAEGRGGATGDTGAGAMNSFLRRRSLIGLGEAVKSENDPAWKARVLKLNNCFQITPPEAAFGAPLEAALGKSKPVNSAGDCPEPKPAAGTPAPATGPVTGTGTGTGTAPVTGPASGASGVAPVPRPPVIAPSAASR